jgi:site-specific DNA-methyltransferase (adenine-specific)
VIAQTYEEAVPLERLTPSPENVNEGDVGAIAESIQTNGFYGSVIAQRSSGTIIAGEHRWRAAQATGGETVPVIWLDVDDEQARRIRLVDNRTTRLGRDDEARLAELLTELAATDLGLAGTGYDGDDLDQLLADVAPPPALTDPDDAPSEPDSPVTQSGDLWQLGPHRVLCGDARDAAAYARVLSGGSVDCVVTDPPYGVGIGGKNRALDALDALDKDSGRVTTDLDGDLDVDARDLWRDAFPPLAAALPPGCPYYVFGPQRGDLGLLLLLLLKESGLAARHILTWVKNRPSFSIGRYDYDYQHEPIAYGWTPGGPHPWHADGPRTSVLNFDRPQRSPDHPTMKPVALLAHLIENSTRPGALILDPFAGSGSTLIAAHGLNRHARLIEIDPRYCDVICRRFQAHTGITPERDGVPHDFTGSDDDAA